MTRLNNFLYSCSLLLGTFFLSGCVTQPLINIGSSSGIQTIKENKITEGLTHFKIKIADSSGSYTLSSHPLSNTEADKLTVQLAALKVVSSTKLTSGKNYNTLTRVIVPETDPNGLSLGELVQYGRYDSIVKAKRIQKQLAEQGVELVLSHTSLQANEGGPFEVSILKLNSQRYKGQLISALAHNGVANAQETSKIAESNHAIAAVNAGFFVHRENFGILGDPAGIAVIDGQLVSEAVVGRPALLIKNNPTLSVAILDNVITTLAISIDGKEYLLNGINREVGKILNCGQQIEQKSILAAHDYLCESSSEIIVYNYLAGDLSALNEKDEFSFFIDNKKNIYSINKPYGDTVPKGHYLIRAIGKKAVLLQTLLQNSQQASIHFKVHSHSGELNLEKGMYIVNGGPTLLINGKEEISLRPTQGWGIKEYTFGSSANDDNDKIDLKSDDIKNRKQFYYNWMVRRHPRTAVGTTKNGDAYFVVVYGRNPGVSAGASVTEMAKIMKGLKVDKAMNLDGGGSSIMVIDGIQTGIPSDVKGERAVGDALLFLPSKVAQ